MSRPGFEFWFDFASPYSFLSAMRLPALAREHGVTVSYRPFMLGVVLRDKGWKGTPVDDNPAKERYMWRDVERLAQSRGHGFQTPSRFPRNPTLANRVARLAAAEGWVEAFVPRAFVANFVEDRDIGDPEVVAELVSACGQPASVLERAQGEPNRAAIRADTAEALSRGLFGAPCFTVGDELFWGDDRLEQALEWWRRG